MARASTATWLGRLYDTLPRFLRPVEFRIAQTTEELLAASQLVYREYVKRGYASPNASALKLSLYQALPHTATFIARHRNAGVIGTVTLIEDSPLGLPMDESYKAEVDELRRRGLRTAEATLLALNSDLFGRGVFTLFHSKKLMLTLRLFRVLFEYLRSSTSVDELVACFNPKHKIFYDFLQLKPLGELKTYPGANGNPAIACHLNIPNTELQAKAAAPYRLFYGYRPSSRPFARKLRLTSDDLRRLFVAQTSILSSASTTELAYLKSCYPTYDFQAILPPSPTPSSTPQH